MGCTCPGCRAGQHGAILVLHHGVNDGLGVDHHLICSGAALNSQRASMYSSPLFIMVAESTEILAPWTSWDGQWLAPG